MIGVIEGFSNYWVRRFAGWLEKDSACYSQMQGLRESSEGGLAYNLDTRNSRTKNGP
jgi:hypothetical protein